jgi:hypothetical protein
MNSFGFATPMATPPRGDPRQRSALPAKTIPFDYVFQFALRGVRGNKVQDVVEISTEGVFVALSVGYSLMLDEKSIARTFQPVVDPRITLENPVFVPFFIPPDLIEGISFRFAGLLLTGVPGTEMAILNLNTTPLITPPTHRIRPDGTIDVTLDTLGDGSILRVLDKAHNRLSELYTVNSAISAETPVIPDFDS